MKSIRHLIIAACLGLTWPAMADESIYDRVEFSGFGRLVAGYLDTDEAVFAGYDNSVSFSEQSLLGVQADVAITDNLSFTTQLLAHSGDNRDSGVEWLYLTYKPTLNTQIRVGKQRTPFYSYSDVIDVGYAYPWITPPKSVYNDYLFSTYEGINLQYFTALYDVLFTLEGYWGSDDSDFEVVGEVFKPDINDLRGIIVKFQGEKLSGRFSINAANIRLQLPQLQGFIDALNQAGFDDSARSLSIDDSGQFYHAGLKYEELNWFVEAEYSAGRSDVLVIPTLDGFALTGAYSWHPITLFASYGNFDSDFSEPENEIPVGVTPMLDELAFGYLQVFNSLLVDDSDVYTLGIRHDVSDAIAIKVSATYIDGKSNTRSFFERADEDFNRRSMLYQAALEWVF